MYFNSFPIIPYDSVGKGQYKDVTNLLRLVAMSTKVRTNALLFDTYDVNECVTPEMIAYKLYCDSELHWIILLVNDITDRYHQWPMSTGAFNKYVADKYTNINGIHHYEITETSGDRELKIDVGITNDDYPSATPITNYEYEVARQNELRNIKLLDPRFVSDFVDEFKDLVQESVF